MSRRKNHGGHVNHERWLVSYADFITLLFAFFVVMFASSQTDKTKAKQMSESVKQAFEDKHFPASVASILGGAADDKGKGNAQMKGPGGAEVKAPLTAKEVDLLPSLKLLSESLSKEIQDGKIEVSMQPRGLVVSLKQAAFFPSAEDAIAQETFDSLSKIATVVKGLPNSVRLEGHTDAMPIKNARFRSNWELSAARSIATRELFCERFGVPAERMAIVGYAETVPVASNDTPEGRAQNRRVDILILNEHGLLSEPQKASPKPSALTDPKSPSPHPAQQPSSTIPPHD